MMLGLQTFKNGVLDLDITSRYTRVLGRLVLPSARFIQGTWPSTIEQRAYDPRFSLGTPFWLCTSDSTTGTVNDPFSDDWWDHPNSLLRWQATHPDVWMEGDTIVARYTADVQLGSSDAPGPRWGGCVVTYGVF